MFQSAAIKLTTWYLAIIMVLSIGTSIALYHVSSNYLEQNARRQIGYFGGLFGPESASEFGNLRKRQLHEDRRQLRGTLIIFNLLVLAGGGAASYGLARRTLRPIEEALEAQIRFTADASHEFRTPLTAIQAENEVALRNPKLSKPEAVEILKSNLEEVGKLKSLAEGLLSLAVANNAGELTSAISSNDLITMSAKRVSKVAKLKKIELKLPAESTDLMIKGNEKKLVDLLVLLLDNAIKYSPRGSRVKIGVKKQGKYVEISVADQGPGIKKADLPNIFERFYRADQSRNKQSAEGYGLGLSIAKKIVDEHEGFIEVRSADGKGSVFNVRLPRL